MHKIFTQRILKKSHKQTSVHSFFIDICKLYEITPLLIQFQSVRMCTFDPDLSLKYFKVDQKCHLIQNHYLAQSPCTAWQKIFKSTVVIVFESLNWVSWLRIYTRGNDFWSSSKIGGGSHVTYMHVVSLLIHLYFSSK